MPIDHALAARAPGTRPSPTIRVAIVIPVYKHPGLLPEALTSALSQDFDLDYAVVVVNDGCPFEETHQVCLEYAQRHPGRLLYVRKPNGGLSSARNAGIDVALRLFPDLDAIYLLDADNILLTSALRNHYQLLIHSESNVGWIYPDIDKIGLREFASVGGAYDILEHLCWNFCEAGSMVRASMLRAGLRFDQSMQAGYEDWEFWLQCIGAGFVGRHLPASGFRYRRRAESMLKGSERQHGTISTYIRDKHPTLFSPRALIDLEDAGHGRYAVICRDSGTWYRCTDPSSGFSEFGVVEFARRASKAVAEPGFLDLPPFVVLTTEAALDTLRRFKMLSGVFWEMQRRVGRHGIASLSLKTRASEARQISLDPSVAGDCEPHVVMIRSHELLGTPQRDGDVDRDAALNDPSGACLSFLMPLDVPDPVSVDGFLAEIRDSLTAHVGQVSSLGTRMTDVQRQRARLSDPAVYSKAVASTHQVFPLSKDGNLHLGILLPTMTFGGAEKVAMAYAKCAAALGARIHIVLCGLTQALVQDETLDIASTITFFNDTGLNTYPDSVAARDYFGAPLTTWPDEGDLDAAFGLLCTMDAVINFNVTAFNAVMARLRRAGVRTATSQHLVDLSPFGQPQGTPHQTLAFEHAYDDIIVISRRLRDWFVGMGVPQAKLVVVPNGPGFEIDPDGRARIVAQRAPPLSRPLRLLFMGRFDRQKGLDRLSQIVRRCAASHPDLEWRIVGQPVLDDAAVDLASLERYIRPVALDASTVLSHYAWADAMILPSRFEGVPLSIIEAGEVGCISIATGVGAIDEIVTDGVTGFLIDPDGSEDQIVEQACSIISLLCADDDMRARMAATAAAAFAERDWTRATRPLLERLGLCGRPEAGAARR